MKLGEGRPSKVREVEIIIIRKKLISMSTISTSLAVREQTPRFHVEAWLPFRNREMDYSSLGGATNKSFLTQIVLVKGRRSSSLPQVLYYMCRCAW